MSAINQFLEPIANLVYNVDQLWCWWICWETQYFASVYHSIVYEK